MENSMISTLYTKNPSECSLELFALASEPKDHATYYTSCIVNGVKFVVRSRDERLITQNSGVSTPGENGSMFYGLLEEIVELNYLTHQKVVLFRCKWFKTNNTRSTSLCVTKNNITSISTRDEWWKENQYILATQARQVFYLEDPSRSHHWKVVQEVNHRKIWDKDVIVDADVVHDSNSSDVALTANLEDLEYTRLSGAGPSTEVSFIPTSRVNDDDFIDDDVEYDAVHVLSSDSEDEDSD
ncbi:formin-like protein 18 [Tanacetum coccineum]